MPGEESVLREAAARCNSALDITLKVIRKLSSSSSDSVFDIFAKHVVMHCRRS